MAVRKEATSRQAGRLAAVLAGLLCSAVLAGCERQVAHPPATLQELERMSTDPAQTYPPQTILMHNLQRAADGDLPAASRVNSLRVAAQLSPNNPAMLDQLAGILARPDTPEEVQKEALALLLKADHPELARYVAKVLPTLQSQSPLRASILEWLAKRPQGSALADVVRLWAAEPPGGTDERLFRRIIEGVTGRKWEAGLLEALNSPGFFARGSAIEVLASRVPLYTLKSLILHTPARTEAVSALQVFLEKFDYLPATGKELLLAAWLYQTKSGLVAGAAGLYARWHKDYDYQFNFRDFHLLSRLSRDTARQGLTRSELILRLSTALESRQHVSHLPSARRAADDYVDLFAANVEKLTMSDLWNLYLLDAMFSQPVVQRGLAIVAQRSRAEEGIAAGGLVLYEQGRAAAKLYPPRKGARAGQPYAPSDQMGEDARDCLCRFHTRFEKAYNSQLAGPDIQDLQDARDNNYYGLVITSVSDRDFCAHYYNPRGVVVSLGMFAFEK